MEGLRIYRAGLGDIETIQGMAQIVFRKTYADIITPEQMEYMMEWMYSSESLAKQVDAPGKAFFIAELENVPCGYVSVEYEKTMNDGRKLFHLQKIYVLPDFQGKGLGRELFNHAVAYLEDSCSEPFRIELNVNRDNKAVHFYEHMGMRKDRQGDFPIGLGFYMNDYIFALDKER